MICGGMMSGNWAIGSVCIATSPPSTVTMAMTMATIGRLMKNRDIKISERLMRVGGRLLPGLRAHHGAVSCRRAFNDDAVARRYAGIDHPSASDAFAHLHGSRGEVIVGSDDADLIGALELRHRALGHHQRVVHRPRFGAHTAELAGAERVARIRKCRA